MVPSMRLLSLLVARLLPVVALAFAATPPEILVYSRTAGYRHDSIPVAIDALRTIGINTSLFTPTFSEDPSLFTPAQLASFSVIVFLSNSDEVLDAPGKVAFQDWLEGGGGLVGLHAATACLFTTEAFGVAMGSWFSYHPTLQNATFTKLMSHPTIDMLPAQYNYVEEVYSFRSDPRAVNATVLLSVDPTSYKDDSAPGVSTAYDQGSPHPIAWYRDSPVDLGNGTHNGTMPARMWMTSLGHTNDTWRSPIHLAHVEAGIKWVLEGLSTTNPTTGASASGTSALTASNSPTPASPTTKISSSRKLEVVAGVLAACVGVGALF